MTKLRASNLFDVVCGAEDWVGAGRYRRQKDRLVLTFDTLARKGHLVKPPDPITLVYEGEGNTLRIGETSPDQRWTRLRP